jgi:FkbM family methyltransferase
MIVNKILYFLQKKGQFRILSALIYFMYKIKGKKIETVAHLKEFNVWEFKINGEYFYSSGPGWAYDYEYLLEQYASHLGFQYLPKQGDTVIDVGAGVGEELLIFSKLVGSQGKVVAIEAHPITFKALLHNNKKNRLENTKLLNLAISDQTGKIFIEDSSDSLANKVLNERTSQSFEVDAISIEQLVNQNNLNEVNLLKVNIEGAEQLLIKGIGNALPKIKHMAISCHDFRFENEGIEFFKTKQIVLEFLRRSGFDYVIRDTGSPLLDNYVYAYPAKLDASKG